MAYSLTLFQVVRHIRLFFYLSILYIISIIRQNKRTASRYSSVQPSGEFILQLCVKFIKYGFLVQEMVYCKNIEEHYLITTNVVILFFIVLFKSFFSIHTVKWWHCVPDSKHRRYSSKWMVQVSLSVKRGRPQENLCREYATKGKMAVVYIYLHRNIN